MSPGRCGPRGWTSTRRSEQDHQATGSLGRGRGQRSPCGIQQGELAPREMRAGIDQTRKGPRTSEACGACFRPGWRPAVLKPGCIWREEVPLSTKASQGPAEATNTRPILRKTEETTGSACRHHPPGTCRPAEYCQGAQSKSGRRYQETLQVI